MSSFQARAQAPTLSSLLKDVRLCSLSSEDRTAVLVGTKEDRTAVLLKALAPAAPGAQEPALVKDFARVLAGVQARSVAGVQAAIHDAGARLPTCKLELDPSLPHVEARTLVMLALASQVVPKCFVSTGKAAEALQQKGRRLGALFAYLGSHELDASDTCRHLLFTPQQQLEIKDAVGTGVPSSNLADVDAQPTIHRGAETQVSVRDGSIICHKWATVMLGSSPGTIRSYEVKIGDLEMPQIGWATASFESTGFVTDTCTSKGVGDDAHSWGVDGTRRQFFHDGETSLDIAWKKGDIVRCELDRTAKKMVWYVNGKLAHEVALPSESLFPAMSGQGDFVLQNVEPLDGEKIAVVTFETAGAPKDPVKDLARVLTDKFSWKTSTKSKPLVDPVYQLEKKGLRLERHVKDALRSAFEKARVLGDDVQAALENLAEKLDKTADVAVKLEASVKYLLDQGVAPEHEVYVVPLRTRGYVVQRSLAAAVDGGNNSGVLVALCLRRNCLVVLKLVGLDDDDVTEAGDSAQVKRAAFLKEAAIMTRLTDVYTHAGLPLASPACTVLLDDPLYLQGLDHREVGVLVLPFLTNGSLAGLCGRLNEAEAKYVMGKLIETLIMIHNCNISHRDWKPENIFVSDKFHVCVGDFGASGRLDSSHFSLACTPGFQPPEALTYGGASEDVELRKKFEVWQLGVVAHLLLTGNLPFGDDPMSQRYVLSARAGDWSASRKRHAPGALLCDLSRSVEALDFVGQCLQPSVADRPSPTNLLAHRWFAVPPAAAESLGRHFMQAVAAELPGDIPSDAGSSVSSDLVSISSSAASEASTSPSRELAAKAMAVLRGDGASDGE